MSQWNRVKAVVDEALERDGADRGAYLERTCASDEQLRAEVASLLSAYEAGTSFFDTWARNNEIPAEESSLIGPYRVIERIGRGGMGTVYRAERDDAPFRQQVALKVLHHDAYQDDNFVQRFISERQILASLSHPHIARLYDGGLTEDGRSYFAMELVEGKPITRYCDEEMLTVEERLRLFLHVAEAVRVAHRKLVVHRDLKPSNILVTEDGTPKLLDFGIAKLLDEEAPHTHALTQTGQLLMTPEYAAPEQVTGEAVTTATDVYQLGVLLYELLAGRRPLTFERKTPSVIERVILEKEPDKPSTALVASHSPARRKKPAVERDALADDLDTIALKALRKEPERRYSSVEALKDDVERHLDGRPIAARPVTWRYKARKFVGRNRWSVSATAAFVALLIVYAVTMTIQAQHIAEERDTAQAAITEARQSAQKSQQMSHFLAGLFEKADPRYSGGELTVRDLLDQASEQLDSTFVSYPFVKADLLEVIGSAYRNQGHYQETYALHRQALKLRRENGASRPELATAQNNVGEALYYLSRFDEAAKYYRSSLAIRRRVLDSNDVDIAQSLNNLALLDLEAGRFRQAKRRYRKALAIFRARLSEKHWRTANVLNNLAYAESQTGSLKAAEDHFRRALYLRKHISTSPDRDVGIMLDHMANVVRRRGRPKEAEKMHRRALDIFRRATADDAPFVGYALLGLALDRQKQGHYDEANRLFKDALAHYRKGLPEGHERLAEPLTGWGAMYLERDRPKDAEPLLREALRVRQKAFPEGHWKTAEVRCKLAAALRALHRYDEAETTLLEGYDALRQRQGPRNRRVRAVQKQLVRLYDAWGRPARAAAYRDSLRQTAPRPVK